MHVQQVTLPWDAHQLNLSSYRRSEVRSGKMWYQYPRLFYLHSLVPSPPPQLVTYLPGDMDSLDPRLF